MIGGTSGRSSIEAKTIARVQAAGRDVEHAETAHQEADEVHMVGGLVGEIGETQQVGDPVGREQDDRSLELDDPAEDLDGSGRAALLGWLDQPTKMLAENGAYERTSSVLERRTLAAAQIPRS